MSVVRVLSRLFRHFAMTRWHLTRAFSARTLRAIETGIGAAERTHGGELRFVVERELSAIELLRNVSPRERAVELFGQLGIWDTADNNGVLIYVLLADRDVEIVADRGFRDKVTDAEWREVCGNMETAFGRGDFESGSLAGIQAASALMARSYPTPDGNELADAPLVL